MNKQNLFIRSNSNPILKPDPLHEWENWKLYNPGVIFHDGQYHLYYRAINKSENWKSAIGYAIS
ncbi:MAG: hypothetical protein PHW95_05660, partial [Patescibacteria group bacterium]|nr:hypothetical protein [Patescibacteria group bacterium]